MHSGLVVEESAAAFAKPLDSALCLMRNQKCTRQIIDSAIFSARNKQDVKCLAPLIMAL